MGPMAYFLHLYDHFRCLYQASARAAERPRSAGASWGCGGRCRGRRAPTATARHRAQSHGVMVRPLSELAGAAHRGVEASVSDREWSTPDISRDQPGDGGTLCAIRAGVLDVRDATLIGQGKERRDAVYVRPCRCWGDRRHGRNSRSNQGNTSHEYVRPPLVGPAYVGTNQAGDQIAGGPLARAPPQTQSSASTLGVRPRSTQRGKSTGLLRRGA
jgi:hypothetical protein